MIGLLADAFDGRVTLLFIPHGRADGSLDPESGIELSFRASCASLGLSCVDMRTRFADMLEKHAPPFGFSNTSPNVGHMNAAGHREVADALFDELSPRLHELL